MCSAPQVQPSASPALGLGSCVSAPPGGWECSQNGWRAAGLRARAAGAGTPEGRSVPTPGRGEVGPSIGAHVACSEEGLGRLLLSLPCQPGQGFLAGGRFGESSDCPNPSSLQLRVFGVVMETQAGTATVCLCVAWLRRRGRWAPGCQGSFDGTSFRNTPHTPLPLQAASQLPPVPGSPRPCRPHQAQAGFPELP
ncbi:uncharacterized protein LOC126084692 isoform X3 [Elephas maximus indicus]|uniref:uncharacterized protein LOC126084692 isoform X3 n=1 Tax=Elephas maximus indicus TaxID=99487 RepID=UPI002116B58F|nr:uncharacterized protein LOC126084692 isoform X3 [Elephas maximus indicus]